MLNLPKASANDGMLVLLLDRADVIAAKKLRSVRAPTVTWKLYNQITDDNITF